MSFAMNLNSYLGIHRKQIFFFILFIGLLARIYISFFVSLHHMFPDSVGYFQQADELLAGRYVNYFPNGYPIIIAVLKAIGGTHPTNLILLLNVILSTITIFFIYRIAQTIFKSEGIALLAAFLMAVYPTQINYVRWFASEVPFTFFLTGAFLFYYYKNYWFSGLLFGVAVVIRTEILAIIPLIILLEAIFKKRINTRLFIASMIPVLAICTYCYSKTGVFSMAGHDKINILYAVTASGSSVDWNYPEKHPEVKSTGDAMKLYFGFLKSSPGAFVMNKAANYWELWGFFPSSSNGNRGFMSRLLIGLSNFFLVTFGIFGWWKNRKNLDTTLLILPFIVVTAVHVMLTATPRYTYPVEPFMILLASWTIYYFIKHRQISNQSL